MTPDFAEWLLQTPEAEGIGPVFRCDLLDLRTNQPLSSHWVGQIVGKIGRKAGVVVNKADRRFAGAHDLRRSFGSRWCKQVMAAVLQRLMRHANIQTTMKFYV